MPLDPVENFVRGGVAASIASSDTTISVDDASIYPDPANGNYNLVLWDANLGTPQDDPNREIVRVTGRDTTNNNLTVSRGQENTSAASHPDTSELTYATTAKILNNADTYLEELADFTTSPTEVTAPVNNSSVTTAEADVTNAPSGDDDVLRWQEGAEVGSVTANGVDNSTGNNDWGQSAAITVTTSFSSAFVNVPKIATAMARSIDNVPSDEYRFDIGNKSTTGFDFIFRQIAAVDNSGKTDAYGADYVATEGR